MESSIWVLSREAYMYIFNIINNDNDVLLESVSDILAHVNSNIKCDDGRDFWITEPLIFTAMRLSKIKCIRWLFSHGTSPRLQDGGQSLLAQAFIYGHERLVLDKGVPLELCANDWFELSMRTKPLSLPSKDCTNFIHLHALRKILHYGIVIPLGNPCVHPDILQSVRNNACARRSLPANMLCVYSRWHFTKGYNKMDALPIRMAFKERIHMVSSPCRNAKRI